ncbi:MAG: hypothetical protein R3F48_04085 [Candidatus Zixiibacteriota bacterium]
MLLYNKMTQYYRLHVSDTIDYANGMTELQISRIYANGCSIADFG